MLELHFRKKGNGVPILSKDEMDDMAEMLLADYDPKLLEKPTSLNIELFSENYVGLEMDYKDLTPNQSTLGAMVFGDGYIKVYNAEANKMKPIPVTEGTVIIDNSLLEPRQLCRGRFTLGHEIGHWLFHRHMYIVDRGQLTLFDDLQENQTNIKCRFSDIENPRRKLETDNDWMEWHADYMASALLMPKTTFKMAAHRILRQVGLDSDYYKHSTGHDWNLYAGLLAVYLSKIFNVSITAAKIRLKKLGIFTESNNGTQFQFDNTV